MIFALFALSIAMIVGGIASVVQGFPFVRLESGLAMTIAGATTASAGGVLLGLAVLAGQVRGLGRRLAEAASTMAASSPPESMPGPALQNLGPPDLDPLDLDAAEPKLQGARRPVIAGAAGLAAGAAGAAHLGAPAAQARPNPTFEEPAAEEPLLPDLLPDFPPPQDRPAQDRPFHEEPPRAGPQDVPEQRRAEGDQDIALQEPLPEPQPANLEPGPGEADLFAPSEAPALRPAMEDVPPPPAAPAPPALDVVGTYVSGGNTYVMFSDGSIEAETPRGRFTFESLEELKAFVEAGGEGETRGIA